MKYQRVISGGTFDLLHKGHKTLITRAFEVGDFVRVGLTTDQFNRERGKKTFENQATRQINLTYFLDQNFANRYKIHFISDVLGGAENDPELEAIIVTPETHQNAEKVNQARLAKNFSKLEIISLKPEKDLTGKIITSTRIRNGEIDAQGTLFLDFLLSISDKPLSEEIKNQFKRPFGEIIRLPEPKSTKIITVGDITTQAFLKNGITPNLSIIDFKTRRHHQFNSILELGFPKNTSFQKVKNAAGTISKPLIISLSKPDSEVILVTGEEDLAVIPAVLLSELGTKVYYGQPDQGIVEITVTPEMKKNLLKKLSIPN